MQPLEAGARGMDDKRGPTQSYKYRFLHIDIHIQVMHIDILIFFIGNMIFILVILQNDDEVL